MNNDKTKDLNVLLNTFNDLSISSRDIIIMLIRKFADQENININATSHVSLQSPADGIYLWQDSLKLKHRSQGTIDLYTYWVRQYLKRDPNPTRYTIQNYLTERIRYRSPSTVNNERKALASFFCFLFEEGYWHTNPTDRVKAIRYRLKEQQCPKEQDIMIVLNSARYRNSDNDRFRILIQLLVTTGLRVSEAASILRSNIDYSAREITIIGKGEKRRIVPLLPEIIEALKKYAETHQNQSPYLFPGNTKKKYMDVSSFRRSLRRACQQLDVVPFSPHQLRHFYATRMLKSGAKVEIVAKILGHAGVGVTCDVYRHVITDELHKENEKHAPALVN